MEETDSMDKKLSDILVVSDMDGTLLTPDCTISPSDIATIRLFRELGGHFTVATGRTFASVRIYPEVAEVIDPAITCGGCVIYNFAEDKPEKSTIIPHLAAHKALHDVLTEFPDIGSMIMGGDMRLYQIASSQQLEHLINSEKMTYFMRPEDSLPEEWNKVLFAGPGDMLKEVEEYVKLQTYPGVYFVSTHPIYYEMMPKGVSKGTALQDLCEMLDISMKNTYMIGDYYNDVDIMKQAGYAVAMGNAPEDVKMLADEVTASNTESGVGQFLYKLIREHTDN